MADTEGVAKETGLPVREHRKMLALLIFLTVFYNVLTF